MCWMRLTSWDGSGPPSNRKHRFFNSLERRIELTESDLKHFFRDLAEHNERITRLESN